MSLNLTVGQFTRVPQLCLIQSVRDVRPLVWSICKTLPFSCLFKLMGQNEAISMNKAPIKSGDICGRNFRSLITHLTTQSLKIGFPRSVQNGENA